MSVPYNPPPFDGLDIAYQDDYLLVVDKPSGLLSVPGRGADKQDCLASRVQQSHPSALIVHRLDMGTSGLLVLALDKESHRRMGLLFEKRLVEKRYIAVVDGKPETQCGEIDLPLITDWPNRPRQMIDHENGKPAQTFYECLEYDAQNDSTRIRLTPKTGRSHQLRVHMQALGHPILGDELYASEQAVSKAERLLLHAYELGFEHPVSGKSLSLKTKLPF